MSIEKFEHQENKGVSIVLIKRWIYDKSTNKGHYGLPRLSIQWSGHLRQRPTQIKLNFFWCQINWIKNKGVFYYNTNSL